MLRIFRIVAAVLFLSVKRNDGRGLASVRPKFHPERKIVRTIMHSISGIRISYYRHKLRLLCTDLRCSWDVNNVTNSSGDLWIFVTLLYPGAHSHRSEKQV